MSKATFRNDSAASPGTIYLEEYGHQQIAVSEVVTILDDNQSTKFADSTQLLALINSGDLVYIDDLGADRTATDAIQILEAIRDKVIAGGIEGEYLCTNATGDLVWGAGAIIIKEEGTIVTSGNCSSVNFIGLAITATDAGSGQVNVTVVALQNIVEDTTPQLGGQLDVNGFAIGNGTEALIKFIETGSAVNEITITNATTGNGPSITATGADSDIDLVLSGKGTGNVNVTTDLIIAGDLTVNGTTTTINTTDLAIADNQIYLNSDHTGAPTQGAGILVERGSSTDASILWDETADVWKVGIEGSETEISLLGHTHVEADITDLQAYLLNVVEDTTPQLGGMLDVNGFGIGDGTNLLLGFIEDPSGVNYLQVENGATGEGAYLRAVGADTNVDLNIEAQGTGAITVNSTIRAKGVATDADLVLDTQGAGVINASTNIIQNVVDPVAAQDAATKNYVDTNAQVVPTGLTGFHDVFRFYEQGATSDIYMMRSDSLISNKYPEIALANGRIVHITSSREKDATKFCDIVIRKQTASGTTWSSGTWTDIGAALTMNNTILSDTFTNLSSYTFNAGDGIAVYLDKSTPPGGASVEDPYVAIYVKYD